MRNISAGCMLSMREERPFEHVISGEVWLELDGGKGVHLRADDIVLINGVVLETTGRSGMAGFRFDIHRLVEARDIVLP